MRPQSVVRCAHSPTHRNASRRSSVRRRRATYRRFPTAMPKARRPRGPRAKSRRASAGHSLVWSAARHGRARALVAAGFVCLPFCFGAAERLAVTSGQTVVHPFDDPLVIAGHGTIGLEILSQLKERRQRDFAPSAGFRSAFAAVALHAAAGRRLVAVAVRTARIHPRQYPPSTQSGPHADSTRSSAAWAAADSCRASPRMSRVCARTCGECGWLPTRWQCKARPCAGARQPARLRAARRAHGHPW